MSVLFISLRINLFFFFNFQLIFRDYFQFSFGFFWQLKKKYFPTSLYFFTLSIRIIQIHQLPTLPNILLERRHPNSTVLKRKSFLMHWQNSVISVINVSVDNSNWKNIWKKLIIWPLFKHNRIEKNRIHQNSKYLIEFIEVCNMKELAWKNMCEMN